jgi:TPR repeat protein
MQNSDDLKSLYQEQSDDETTKKNDKVKPGFWDKWKPSRTGLFIITLFAIGFMVIVTILNYTGPISPDDLSDSCDADAIEPSEEGKRSDEAAQAIKLCPAPRIVELALAIQTTSPGKALALLEVAVQRNYGPAARLIGEMYDPRFWNEKTSPFKQPNARNAMKWYNKAIALNDATAHELLQQLQSKPGP